MKKIFYIFGFLILFFPFTVLADCFNASNFGDNSANGIYFDNNQTHNGNPSYANDTGYYIYTYVQDSVYYEVTQNAIIANDTPGIIWYYKEIVTPYGEYTTFNGAPEPGGVISQIDCPSQPPGFTLTASNNIEDISYIATTTKINATQSITTAIYKIPAILFCFIAIIFMFCLMVIYPLIYHKK